MKLLASILIVLGAGTLFAHAMESRNAPVRLLSRARSEASSSRAEPSFSLNDAHRDGGHLPSPAGGAFLLGSGLAVLTALMIPRRRPPDDSGPPKEALRS